MISILGDGIFPINAFRKEGLQARLSKPLVFDHLQ